jgi:hypothetical protein
MLRALAIASLLASATTACASPGDAPVAAPRATPTPARPTSYPVAYRLSRGAVRTLPETDAWKEIDRSHVVASSEWQKPYPALVLVDWLHDQRIDLGEPRELRPVLERLAHEQELSLLILTAEHRRYAKALAKLHPSRRELRTFYEDFSEEDWPQAGEAMLDWLRVVRLAVANADARHVVVIPLLD